MVKHAADGANSHFIQTPYDHSGATMNRPRAAVPPQISLDAGSNSPIYRQLYDWFQQAILEGRLRAGQRLPSTRALAAELKVSRIPVLAAYEQLQAEGYLESFVGAGTCVARSIPAGVSRPVSKTPAGASRRNSPRRISRNVECALSSPLFPTPASSALSAPAFRPWISFRRYLVCAARPPRAPCRHRIDDLR